MLDELRTAVNESIVEISSLYLVFMIPPSLVTKDDQREMKAPRPLGCYTEASGLFGFDYCLFYCFIWGKIDVSVCVLPMKHFHLELVICPLTFSVFHF